MKILCFDVYSDPGHAWVKVSKRQMIRFFGNHWRKEFTCCSYERKDHVYLEEDKDASTFVQRLRDQGITPDWRQHHTDRISRIRNYNCLAPL